MKALTVEDMLQIGWGCGLTNIDEAFGQIMTHHDLFFKIPYYDDPQFTSFCDSVRSAGLVGDDDIILEMQIEDAAKMIGYTLTEIDLPPVPESVEQTDPF